MVVKSPLTPLAKENFADELQAIRWLNRLHNWSCKKTKSSDDGDQCWEVGLRHGGCRVEAGSCRGFLPASQAAANKLHKAIAKKHSPKLRLAR